MSTVRFEIDREAWCGAEELGASEEATSYMVYLASFFVLVHGLSGDTDLFIPTLLAARDIIEWESMVGFFLNVMIVRLKFDANDSFRNVVRRVRDVCLDGFDNREMSVADIMGDLPEAAEIASDPDYVWTLFQMMTIDGEPPAMSGLQVERLWSDPVDSGMEPGTSEQPLFPLDLLFSVLQIGATRAGLVEFNSNLFQRSSIERFNELYSAILAQGGAHPDRSIADLLTVCGHSSDRTADE